MGRLTSMYTPPFNREDDDVELRAFVAAVHVGWLVTSRADAAPAASFLPLLWQADTVIAHLAKANTHWREIGDATPALLIVTGPDAYVSPSWYAAKAEHGKVVPTWNYSAVHLTGVARVHEEAEWLRMAVTDLTERHEGQRDRPWHVTDAPAAYIEGQLHGIVGIEFAVTGVEGKSKWSQNRSTGDRAGVIEGLRGEGGPDGRRIADAMAASLDRH